MAFQMFGQPQQAMTPEGISRQRQIAQALLQQGMDTSPVQHWSQGAARIAQALLGGYKNQQAEQAAMTLQKQEEAKAQAAKAEAAAKAQQEAQQPVYKYEGGQWWNVNPNLQNPLAVSQAVQKKDELTAYQKAQMEERRKDREWRQRQQQAGKIPNAVQTKNLESETAVANLTNALDQYDALVQKGGYAHLGGERDAVNTARTNIQMQMKELYNLGVLNGPDLELMNKMLVDPTYSLGATFNPLSEERGAGTVIANGIGDTLGLGTGIKDRVSANVKQLKDQFRSIVQQRLKTTGAPTAPTLQGPALDNRYQSMSDEDILRELGQ